MGHNTHPSRKHSSAPIAPESIYSLKPKPKKVSTTQDPKNREAKYPKNTNTHPKGTLVAAQGNPQKNIHAENQIRKPKALSMHGPNSNSLKKYISGHPQSRILQGGHKTPPKSGQQKNPQLEYRAKIARPQFHNFHFTW